MTGFAIINRIYRTRGCIMAHGNKKRALNRRALNLMRRAHILSGRSIRGVGRRCYLDHSYVARILKGTRRPRRDKVILLCLRGWGLNIQMTDDILEAGQYLPLHLEAAK